MWKITHKDNQYRRGGRGIRAVAVVFLDHDRPITKGDIIGDFAWRRRVSYSEQARDPELIKLIAGELNLKPEEIKLEFSTKAGCTCPCSPGLLVRALGSCLSVVLPALHVEEI